MNTLEARARLDPRARAAARASRSTAGATRSRTSSRSRTSPTARKQAFDGRDRWALVGEAGPFLDPFYSPGSDYIAMANTLTTRPGHARARRRGRGRARRGAQRLLPERLPDAPDLLRGPVRVLAQPAGHEREDRRQQHPLLGRARRCCSSTASSPTSSSWRAVRPDIERIWAITRRLEAMYREWNALESREWRRAMVPPVGVPRDVRAAHRHGRAASTTRRSRQKLASTAELMEAYAVLAFHRAASALPRRRARRGREDQPLRGQPRPRALGGGRPLRRRGHDARRGARRRRRRAWRTSSWRPSPSRPERPGRAQDSVRKR